MNIKAKLLLLYKAGITLYELSQFLTPLLSSMSHFRVRPNLEDQLQADQLLLNNGRMII